MKTYFIAITFFGLALLPTQTVATTVSTPAAVAARGLRGVITDYLQKGGDINALSMQQVMRMVDVEAANSTAQGKFEDRFEILGGRGPVDQQTKAQMIAYTTNQIGEDRREGAGRYVIWLANGEVNYNWEPEQKVSSLLSSAGMKFVNKGVWTQPDTKAQSMFHVGARPKPPPNDNRVAEDVAGHRLPKPEPAAPNASTNNAASAPKQSQSPQAVQPPTPKAPEAKPTQPTPSKEPVSSTPWSIIVVLAVAAAGLFWWLRKRRS